MIVSKKENKYTISDIEESELKFILDAVNGACLPTKQYLYELAKLIKQELI